MKKPKESKLLMWVEARERTGLSHKHIQMARELKMKPEKLHLLIPKKGEDWKAPLGFFIEECYWKRFEKGEPDQVFVVEDIIKRNKDRSGE